MKNIFRFAAWSKFSIKSVSFSSASSSDSLTGDVDNTTKTTSCAVIPLTIRNFRNIFIYSCVVFSGFNHLSKHCHLLSSTFDKKDTMRFQLYREIITLKVYLLLENLYQLDNLIIDFNLAIKLWICICSSSFLV